MIKPPLANHAVPYRLSLNSSPDFSKDIDHRVAHMLFYCKYTRKKCIYEKSCLSMVQLQGSRKGKTYCQRQDTLIIKMWFIVEGQQRGPPQEDGHVAMAVSPV